MSTLAYIIPIYQKKKHERIERQKDVMKIIWVIICNPASGNQVGKERVGQCSDLHTCHCKCHSTTAGCSANNMQYTVPQNHDLVTAEEGATESSLNTGFAGLGFF